MILANVIFGTRRGRERETLEDLAESYLGTLAQLGHLCGPYFLTWTKGRLNAHVLLAAAAALETRHHTKRSKNDLKVVTTAFGRSPVWKILDDDAKERPSTWKGAPFLYLFTDALTWASPVRRGDGENRPWKRQPCTCDDSGDEDHGEIESSFRSGEPVML